jgi:NAD(P)-dependent dehydrogenase (short-subunit alcohol dehydrogenase family)
LPTLKLPINCVLFNKEALYSPCPGFLRSYILLTGGAHGITSCIAVALAERFGCRLELVGRSPLPPETDPDDPPGVSAAPDLPSLRRALATKGTFREPAAIEAACARILTAREIRGTLSEIRRTGASATYHALDVRDADALRALIGSIYARHGRLDGVVHAAGVLEDKLLTQKTGESFARVFDTKVKSALTLSEALRSDVGFLVFFSSVSGAFGNRGQVDYAAANDALDKLALALSKRLPGRVLSIDWGPWAGNGMVSPELGREYARRGIGLLPPAEGVAAFLDELSRERPDAQIVLMRADPTGTVSFPLQRIDVVR